MTNIRKHYFLAWALVPMFVAASFFGCSSALESDPLSGESTAVGLSASVQKVGAYPSSLAGADWGGSAVPAVEPYYVVLQFTDETTGVLLLSSSNSPEPFTYSYNAATGEALIFTGTYGDGVILSDPDGDTLTLSLPDMADADYGLTLIVPQLTSVTGTVWNTITPRDIYSSIDFETDTVQTTFGDGTFPLYDLIYYDGFSAGVIDQMGLFYLNFNSDGVLTVVFPDFYRYHMGDYVIYTPSEPVRASLSNTVWKAASINETVTFTTNQAVFNGDDPFTASYVYNGYQAGGADNGAGSFIVQDHGGGNPQTISFYAFRGRLPNEPPTVFYKQPQPLEEK